MSVILILFVLWTSLAAAATALETAVAGMAPGDWLQFSTTDEETAMAFGTFGNILEYANATQWDPINKRVYLCGGAHHGDVQSRCVQYDEASNTWKEKGGAWHLS